MQKSSSQLSLLTVLICLCAVVQDSSSSTLMQQLSLIYRDTYLVYGLGRRSERDLPVCASINMACNISHKRLWLTPITERLCRCARKTECPISYVAQSEDSQHVSNRAQYKFCENLDETVETCTDGDEATEIIQEEVMSDSLVGFTRRVTLKCRCQWPKFLVFNRTTQNAENESTLLYTCNELPRCDAEQACGLVRKDTFEVYYTCSCLKRHVCSYSRPLSTSFSSNLPHFHGEVYEAFCTEFY